GAAHQEPVSASVPVPVGDSVSEEPVSASVPVPVGDSVSEEPVAASVPKAVGDSVSEERVSSSGFELVADPVSAPEPVVDPVSVFGAAASEAPGVRVIGTATADEAQIVGGPRFRETPGGMDASASDPDAVDAPQRPAAVEEVLAPEPAPATEAPGQPTGEEAVASAPPDRTPMASPGDAERPADVMETRGLPRTPTDVYGLGAGTPVRAVSSTLPRDAEVETYLDDPEELRLYRIRAGLTVAGGIGLLILFRWAFSASLETLSTMWDIFTGAF
ncbi:MAG: hypothetical protein OEM66_05765, partial [Acidimicrobiia bacterium]|nr:hypothetical protein [Acidimicrobiia bacterium]